MEKNIFKNSLIMLGELRVGIGANSILQSILSFIKNESMGLLERCESRGEVMKLF